MLLKQIVTTSFRLDISEDLWIDCIEKKDLSGPWLSWLRNFDTIQWLEGPRMQAYSQEDLNQYLQRMESSENDLLFAIRYRGSHIGNLTLTSISIPHRHATMGILLGEEKMRNQGISRRSIEKVGDWALNSTGLNLVRLQAAAFSENPASIKAFLAAGFEIEGTWRKARRFDGIFYDMVWMARLNPNV
ncbi:GNAT family N-acetyltransferase [Leptospira noguchii]|uniref:GNAT family N-acetyltransferase n=1 Tax=Leptospira noguchii TaxID=28182 RepID=UPI0011468994|nr:GNAT family protein [Leptospira noguchii]TQE84038.1 GNAT family N-acetyltransferase [Leptospira noguchii]UOG54011.1 GNAT family N-acetyltransferase [Leptospira noguchii]